jgi:threonine synthase
VDDVNIVSLGEGNTPIIRSKLYGPALAYKLEHLNPTGSFKDRGVSVSVSVARQMGARGIVVPSSGNSPSATAAYAARAGLPCIVCIPSHTSRSKAAQARAHGAELLLIDGAFSDSYRKAKEIAREKDYVNTTSTFLNPYNLEGDKMIAFELLEQLGQVPKAILVPTGSGPLVVGVMKGFEELLRQRKTRTLPKMIAVQAASCAPIVETFDKGAYPIRLSAMPATAPTRWASSAAPEAGPSAWAHTKSCAPPAAFPPMH